MFTVRIYFNVVLFCYESRLENRDEANKKKRERRIEIERLLEWLDLTRPDLDSFCGNGGEILGQHSILL